MKQRHITNNNMVPYLYRFRLNVYIFKCEFSALNLISYAELSFGCTSITSVRFCLTFLRIIEHREAISSRASTHVRAEIPIHIPIMPPISDRNLADCWRQQFKTYKVWPFKVFTRKLYTRIKKKRLHHLHVVI